MEELKHGCNTKSTACQHRCPSLCAVESPVQSSFVCLKTSVCLDRQHWNVYPSHSVPTLASLSDVFFAIASFAFWTACGCTALGGWWWRCQNSLKQVGLKKEIGSSLTWKANFKRYTKLLVATNVFHHIHNMVTCHDCALNIWVSHWTIHDIMIGQSPPWSWIAPLWCTFWPKRQSILWRKPCHWYLSAYPGSPLLWCTHQIGLCAAGSSGKQLYLHVPASQGLLPIVPLSSFAPLPGTRLLRLRLPLCCLSQPSNLQLLHRCWFGFA